MDWYDGLNDCGTEVNGWDEHKAQERRVAFYLGETPSQPLHTTLPLSWSSVSCATLARQRPHSQLYSGI